MRLNGLKIKIVSVFALYLLGLSSFVNAAVELELVEPKKFHDADMTGMNKNKGFESLQRDLTNLFNHLSKDYIKDTEKMVVKITDVDLAGYMKFATGRMTQDMRIVKDSERFRLEFSYSIVGKEGQVTKQGDVKLKKFLTRKVTRNTKSKYASVDYMEKDLKKWFEDNFNGAH